MKQKEKKRIASKLFAALVILTLISCCFLGVTYARYTSSGTGSATVGVAPWEIGFETTDTEETTITAALDMISPSSAEYTGEAYDEEAVRSNTSDSYVLVATIINNSAVNANVTVTVGALTPTGDAGEYAEDLNDIFSIAFFSDDQGTALLDTETLTTDDNELNIYAKVTWTSDTADCFGEDADARDTFIGQNVTQLKWALTFTAVQASTVQ